eukprot:349920-Alexandrium_andersonii.AAC.1
MCEAFASSVASSASRTAQQHCAMFFATWRLPRLCGMGAPLARKTFMSLSRARKASPRSAP